MSVETWRPVPGYEDRYEVSDRGSVRSAPRARTRGGVLKQWLRGPYPTVCLYDEGRARSINVHRLVAWAFIGPQPDGHVVRHLDGNAENPVLSNLAYGTYADNEADKRRHGTDNHPRKAECMYGHSLLDPANVLYRTSRGRRSRYCRPCKNDYARKRRTLAAVEADR